MTYLTLGLLAIGQLPPFMPPAAPFPPLPAARPLTHQEFAASFVPCAGTYSVVLLHPKTGKPVQVAFSLPPGVPKVKVGKHYLEYDYGKHEVEIRFRLFGKVDVDYD